MSNPFAKNNAGEAAAPAEQTPATFATAAAGGNLPSVANQAPMTDYAKRDAARANLVEEVDFDSDISSGRLRRIPKMSTGEKTRWAFLLFSEKGSPKFKSVEQFSFGWDNNDRSKKGVSFLAPKHNPELYQACVKAIGDPSVYFGTILLHYNTDKEGNMSQTGNYELEAFKAGFDKFNTLKSRHAEWPLSEHDLVVTCTEESFQKLDMTSARDCFWRAADETTRNEIVSAAQALYDGSLDRLMGFYRSDEDIIQFLKTGAFPDNQNRSASPAPAAAAPNVNPFAAQSTPAQPALSQQAGVGDSTSASFADLANQQSAGTQTPPQDDAAKAMAEDLQANSAQAADSFAAAAGNEQAAAAPAEEQAPAPAEGQAADTADQAT